MKHLDFKSFVRGRPRLPARLLHAPRARQRGAAVLLTVVLLLMIAAVGITRYAASGASLTVKHVTDNSAQIAVVKAALIAFAMNGRTASPPTQVCTINPRPGELPCPDLDNDGYEECTCTGTQRVGRVPWKTLGIPDPKDAAGETLWYVLSSNFRPYTAGPPTKINSDTKGSLPVYKDDLGNQLTAEAIAVIVAPGSAIGNQTRSTSIDAVCTLTGTTIKQNLCANNYLESTNWQNNGPFLMALNSPNPGTFNDQLQALTTADVIPLVEQRVGADVIALFKQYKTAVKIAKEGDSSVCDCFPYAADLATLAGTGVSTGTSLFGNPPLVTASPTNWGERGTPTVPAYLLLNDWWRVLFYQVGDRVTQAPTASMVLSLPAYTGNTSVVIITPGPAGSSRPSTDWTQYIDDVENSNADTNFATPTSHASTKDRLFTVPYPYP